MKKIAVFILLCALLAGCSEQFQSEGQGDDSSELVSNAETTTTATTTATTTSTADSPVDEPIEVQIDDPLAGFVPVEYTPLYEVEAGEDDKTLGPVVLPEDIPAENLGDTDADLFIKSMYEKAGGILMDFTMPGVLVTSINDTIIYNGFRYSNASCPSYTNLSEFINYCNLLLSKDYILAMLGGVGLSNRGAPFIEYQGRLYAMDGVSGSGAMALNGEKTFYKVSQTDTQAVYEVYYGYDPEFTGFDCARKRYVVLQKENGRWLVADGGFWMDLV